jgi:hypothetical protein
MAFELTAKQSPESGQFEVPVVDASEVVEVVCSVGKVEVGVGGGGISAQFPGSIPRVKVVFVTARTSMNFRPFSLLNCTHATLLMSVLASGVAYQ